MSYQTRSLIAAASLVIAAAVPQMAQASTVTSIMNFDSLHDGDSVLGTYASIISAGQGFTYNLAATVFDAVANSGNAFGTPPSPSNILAFSCAGAGQCADLSFTSTADIIGIDFSGFIEGGGSIKMVLSGHDAANNATSYSTSLTTSTSWETSVSNFGGIAGLRSVTFSAGAGTFGLDDIVVRTVAATSGGGGNGVPEPASLALAGLGLAGLLASRRSKKA